MGLLVSAYFIGFALAFFDNLFGIVGKLEANVFITKRTLFRKLILMGFKTIFWPIVAMYKLWRIL